MGDVHVDIPLIKVNLIKKDDEDDSELEEYESIKGDYEDV